MCYLLYRQNMNVESLVGLHNQFMFMQAESQKGLTHQPISDMKLPLLQKYYPFQATYIKRVTALRTEPRVTPAMANHDKNKQHAADMHQVDWRRYSNPEHNQKP